MSQEMERVYTIPLGKVLLSPDNRRAKRAINMIKEFARHHTKVEDIRIDEDVARQIWSRGIRSPPRKIRVRMTRPEGDFVLISRYDEDLDTGEADVTPAPMPVDSENADTDVSDTLEAPDAESDTTQPDDSNTPEKPDVHVKDSTDSPGNDTISDADASEKPASDTSSISETPDDALKDKKNSTSD